MNAIKCEKRAFFEMREKKLHMNLKFLSLSHRMDICKIGIFDKA